MNDLTPEQYLASCGITPETEAYNTMLARMEHYGENTWWISEDARVRAYYQTLEMDESGIGFYDFAQYQKDVEGLIQRDTFTYEFATSYAVKLRQEVERAYKETNQGAQ
jgi:hypothetical protein